MYCKTLFKINYLKIMKSGKDISNTNSNLITYESLTFNENQTTTFEDSPINKNYWKSPEFQKVYFEQNKKFHLDDENLKSEFDKWHKELGRKLYDLETKKFKFIPFKITSIDLTKFLQIHPLLDNKDKRNLELIRQELHNKYKRHIFLNLCVGITMMMTYIKIIGRRENRTVSTVVKKYYIPILFLFTISVIWVDSRFKIYKPKYMGEMLIKKGMDKKYFENYL